MIHKFAWCAPRPRGVEDLILDRAVDYRPGDRL